MNLFFQQILDGAASGAIYAAMALAIVMVHRASKLVNFAQGEMATFGAFTAWQLNSWGLPLVLAIPAAIIVAGLLGILIERTLVRPLGSLTSHLPVIILTLGLMLVINSVMGFIWGYDPKTFPRVFGDGALRLDGVVISNQSLGIVAVVAASSLILWLTFRFTNLGLALRASSENPESARLSGIRVGRMLSAGWAFGGMIGAIAGILVAPLLYLHPNMMATALLYAFAAAVVGGIDSAQGAVVGGILVGILENLAGTYVSWIGNDFKQAVALFLILAVLLVRPQGIFGQKAWARV